MSQDLVKAMNDLYGNVSFSSGGGSGGGGTSRGRSTFSGPAREQERRNRSGNSGPHTPGSGPITGSARQTGNILGGLGLLVPGTGPAIAIGRTIGIAGLINNNR